MSSHIKTISIYIFKFISVGVLGVTLGIILGCEKKEGSNPPSQPSSSQPSSSQPIPKIVLASTIDGYKNFKFGMSFSDVGKQPECTEAYENAIKSENVDLNSYHLLCTIEFLSEKQELDLSFANAKLDSISLTIPFNNEKYQSLNKSLSEKYTVEYIPTSEQISTFNNDNLAFITTSYASNQVLLTAGKFGKRNTITLSYVNTEKASRIKKELLKGAVKGSDL